MLFKRLREFRPVRVFFIEVGLVMSAVIAAIFFGIYLRTDRLMHQTVRDEAVSYYDLVVHTRQWNAKSGGVYVKKGPDAKTNPYLRELGVEPELALKDGTVMTLRNPAMMTREISELAAHERGVRFRLTSQRPVNPANAPDGFEAAAIERFGRGSREEWTVDDSGGEPMYRLIRPLFVEKPCLRCHESQGYRVGDLRGALSVSIPIGTINRALKKDTYIITALGALTLSLLLGTLYLMTVHLSGKLRKAQERITELSVTDELTGLKNRRAIMEKLGEEFERSKRSGRPLGVLMLDLDHFKNVNDMLGHQFGDRVLKAAAERIKAHLRPYDSAGRFGGEEFIVVCPDTPDDRMSHIAERIRQEVRSEDIRDGGDAVAVTTSIGLTAARPDDEDIGAILKRADDALYKAKRAGRDRVEGL